MIKHICILLFLLLPCAAYGQQVVVFTPHAAPGGGETDYCADSYAGLVLDLNPHIASYTDTGCSAAAGDTDAVGCVTDASATGANVTQATGTAQPTLTADGNGWLYLDFDGSSDYLFNASFDAGAQPFTMVLVAQAKGTATINPLIADEAVTGDYRQRDNRNYQLNFGATLRGGTPNTNLRIHHVEANGASSVIYIDNVSEAAGDTSTDAWVAGLNIASTNNQNQFGFQLIYRVLVYDGTLSSGDRTALYSCLNTLYTGSAP